jgi:hypothetical protein
MVFHSDGDVDEGASEYDVFERRDALQEQEM